MSDIKDGQEKSAGAPGTDDQSEPEKPVEAETVAPLSVRITHGDRRRTEELTLSIYNNDGDVTDKTISLAPGADTVLTLSPGEYVHFDY